MVWYVVVIALVMIFSGASLGLREEVSEREFKYGIFFVLFGFATLMGLQFVA